MKLALCLHGLSYGKNDKNKRPILFDLGMKFIKNEIIDKHDIDIFVHTWNKGNKDKILEHYKPKKYIIGDNKKILPRQKSSLYSYMMVNNLRKEYEIENNIKYDGIILTRFDLIIKINRRLDTYDMSKIYFPDNFKLSKDLGRDYYINNCCILEWLIMSNSDNIDNFCKFYYSYDKYFSKTLKKYNGGNPHIVFMVFLLDYFKDLLEIFKLENLRACSGNAFNIIN